MKPISTAEPREESRPIRTPLRASGDGRLGAILYGVGGQLSVLLLRSLVFVDYRDGLEDFGPWWRHRRDGFIREDSLDKNDVAEAEERKEQEPAGW